jgi:probable biosynthetic protein (TIGR04099 family)
MEFLSTFLGRAILGSNRSVKRSVPLDFGQTSIAASRSELAETAHSMRAGNWTTHQGFSRQEAVAGSEFCCRPCPSNDFNGAEFLYFASFQALTDRAEWAMGLTPPNTLARPGYREIYYYGNIDVGEEIRIVLQKTRTGPQAQSLDHWCRVYRKSDGKIIADVFTGKALQALSDLGPKSEALDECH